MIATAANQTFACKPPHCPAHPAAFRRLPDGRRVIIRPIRPQDDDMEKAFIGGLSRDTRYQRLLGARNLTQEEIRRLTHIDYGREMAFIAQDTNGGGGRQLGDAQYVKDGVRGSAEFALVVADAWQHQGVGSLLLQALLQHAQAAGIERLHGITSANNQTMLNLARKFGFAQRPCPGDATLRQVEKTLPLRGLATLDDASAAHTGAAANDERIASPI